MDQMYSMRSALYLLFGCSLLTISLRGMATDQRVVISPTYGPDIWFSVRSHSTDELTVRGSVDDLAPRSIITDDEYKQRFVAMDGRYRIIHTLGQETENRIADGHKVQIRRPVRDVIRFDLSGIFASGPSDPIDLIPLYAGYPVATGDTWMPKAAISTPFGTGTATYTFHVDGIETDHEGHTIARVSVSFVSDLAPSDTYRKGTTSAQGDGWFLWDCTVNQRRETHLRGIYTLTIGSSFARNMLAVDDHLEVHAGRQNF